MGDTTKIPLISSEIAGLWNAYMSESLTVRVLSYFLNRIEDPETQDLLQKTFELSNQHITEITGLFNQAGLPIPDGFTDNDVNINAHVYLQILSIWHIYHICQELQCTITH